MQIDYNKIQKMKRQCGVYATAKYLRNKGVPIETALSLLKWR